LFDYFGFPSQFSLQLFTLTIQPVIQRCIVSILTESLNNKFWEELIAYFPLTRTDRIENDESNNSSFSLRLPPAFTLVSYSAYSSNLKMEAIYSSATSVDFQRTTRCYIPEDSTHQFFYCWVCICCRGNFFTETLPSNDRGIHADGMIYKVCR
jgi:hypothetical protein